MKLLLSYNSLIETKENYKMSKTTKNTIWIAITGLGIIIAGVAGQINRDNQNIKDSSYSIVQTIIKK